jgi:DNA-directed RNA polymerase subunit omega
MARITSQAAVEQIGNRYDLVLVASMRARELRKGHIALTTNKGVSANVTALREIEEGKINGVEYLERLRKEK